MDLYSVKAILVLDNDGERLCGNYYDKDSFPTVEYQTKFEERLFDKTTNNDSEIILFDGFTIVYRSNVDLMFFVVGSCDENELILNQVLECFYECTTDILRKNVEKSEFMAEYSQVLMVIDNMVDNGIIMEIDPDEVLDCLPGRGGGNSDLMKSFNKSTGGIKVGEMTAGQLLNSAKNMLKQGATKF